MKIVEANAGALTNFEVLQFLRSRGATVDPMGCLGAVAPSECKVFDYLIHTAACNQSRENIDEFMKQSENFKLAKAEKLNLINIRPSNQAEAYSIIEMCEERMTDTKIEELVNLVTRVLPPPPPKDEDGKLAFQIMYLYEGLINAQNSKGETALHLLANKPHAFNSGNHLELFDRIIYACIVIHPLAINMIEEYDENEVSQRRNGADNPKYSGDHTDLLAMSKRFLAKIAGTGSDKKENRQGNSGRSSEAPTHPPGSSNHLQPSHPVTNDSLEEILTEGGDAGHEQERTISFPYGAHDQHQEYYGYEAWQEELDNSLNEIITEGDPDEGARARMLSAGLSAESFKAAEEQEDQHNTSRRRAPESYDYSSTTAQILENVAAWSIFLIYALKILLVILGVVGIGNSYGYGLLTPYLISFIYICLQYYINFFN